MTYSNLKAYCVQFHNSNEELEATIVDPSNSKFELKEVIHDAIHTIIEAPIWPSSCGASSSEINRHNAESEDRVIAIEAYVKRDVIMSSRYLSEEQILEDINKVKDSGLFDYIKLNLS